MTVFSRLLSGLPASEPSREAISHAARRPEAEAFAGLLTLATLADPLPEQIDSHARSLVTYWRNHAGTDGIDTMLQAFPLHSAEGRALLCLAGCLLRIPDAATRDALIRDQIGQGGWQHHGGHEPPLFLNAASWAMSTSSRFHAVPGGLRRLAMRGSAPFIRHGVERAMQMMGTQFVPAETLTQALKRSRTAEQAGFSLAYSALHGTAQTAEEAEWARQDALAMVETLARHGRGQSLHDRPSLSLKLSSLHPRFEETQRERVMSELLPFLTAFALRARAANLIVHIDAEQGEKLDLGLDLFDALCRAPELAGWNGLGFTVQAYDKRALPLIDHLIAIAQETGRRIALRLVKGRYHTHEIRQSQAESCAEYTVFTRKYHTDVSFIACARQALASEAWLYPQFATHNARSIATILAIAPPWSPGRYEFGCLFGTGETPYEAVLQARSSGAAAKSRTKNHAPLSGIVGGVPVPLPGAACRLLVPVGPESRLGPLLIDRLIENGVSTSFVNQIYDRTVTLDTLVSDPVALARTPVPRGSPSRTIPLPPDLSLPGRQTAIRPDLHDRLFMQRLAGDLLPLPAPFRAMPLGPAMPRPEGRARTIVNPALHDDHPGSVTYARPRDIDAALNTAEGEQEWRRTDPQTRAACLDAIAEALDADRSTLLDLLIREAGKTLSGATDEICEAINALRYYAAQLRLFDETGGHGAPLGIVLCISPWNFPVSSFTGQVAVALAAGNAVIAKPAEETPLVAARLVSLFLSAGLPSRALQLLPGEGNVGASLVADPRIDGVIFTGSTAVAKTISRELLGRTGRTGQPVPLLSDTSGQNAMIVDSSVPPEQVIPDILASAFDSAGQRSASLRVLLLQEDGAEDLIERLRAALNERHVGAPDRIGTDIGPLISAGARVRVEEHIERMRRAGYRVWQPGLQAETLKGHFVPPTLIEIGRVADIGQEVFGPVLHIRRYARHELDGVIDALNATGYALTFGVQSRIHDTIARACARSRAGNIYVNRAIIGAAIGTQPFGGRGLSGSGPKLGGPLLLPRLMYGAACPFEASETAPVPPAARAFLAFLEPRDPPSARRVRAAIAHRLCGLTLDLPGPSGESNRYTIRPKGVILCACESWPALIHAVGLALGAGNTVLVLAPDPAVEWLRQVSRQLANVITRVDPGALPECDAMLIQRGAESAEQAALTITAREGMVVPVYDLDTVRPEWLLSETVITTNEAVLGGDIASVS